MRKVVSGWMLTLLLTSLLTPVFNVMCVAESSTLSQLPDEVKMQLTLYLQTLSLGWDQQAVDSANDVLSNTTYSSLAWDDFFSEYFCNNSFTDHLRNYLGYPVFWWFSEQVHLNLQEGLLNPLTNATRQIFQVHHENLSDALSNEPELLQTLMNSLRFLNNMVTIGVITDTSRTTLFNFYENLIEAYSYLLKKSITFDITNEPYLATIRAQVYANLRDTKPLTSEIKNKIAQIINVTGTYLEIWNRFSVLVLDNNGLDSAQLDVINNTLGKIPSPLHNLGIITQNDLLGNTGEKYQWLETKSIINILNIKVGTMTENGFPDDVTPKYSDVFTLVLIHEVNHVVDAYYVANDYTLNGRKADLIEAAGNESLNYLRSMFPDDFFTTYPQEFFASISNQWFSDTFNTLQLGLTRFTNGYNQPINQFLFFADVYSLRLNQTIFYTLDDKGNTTKTVVPLTRDSNHHINSLVFNNTRYFFLLDSEGNVLDWNTNVIVVPDVYPTIQEAINNANTGDTIFVRNGTYYENVVVNKTVTLVGENKYYTIVDGNLAGPVMNITANNVNLTGFTLQKCGEIWPSGGIYIDEWNTGNNISFNIITNNYRGIVLYYYSSKNVISGNSLTNNDYGIVLGWSSFNIISRNSVENNQYGIELSSSASNTIFKNNISLTDREGILLMGSSNNIIYHNNLENTEQVASHNSANVWDNGCEGNYWSNYNGSDIDGDGIGDTYLPWEEVDHYPLMNRYWNPSDINHDLKVDIKDIARAAKAFGSYLGHYRWNPHADITGPEYLVPDGKVDIRDIALIAINFGKIWTP